MRRLLRDSTRRLVARNVHRMIVGFWQAEGLGCSAQVQPELLQDLRERNEVREIVGFHQKRIGTQTICVVDVLHLLRRRQDDDAQRGKPGMRTQPAEDFEAVETGKFQVQQQEIRQGVFDAIGIYSVTLQIQHHFRTGGDDEKWVADSGFRKSAFQKQDIVLFIFGNQNNGAIRHDRPKSLAVNILGGDGVMTLFVSMQKDKGRMKKLKLTIESSWGGALPESKERPSLQRVSNVSARSSLES